MLVVALSHPQKVQQESAEAAFTTRLETGERVQPIVCPIEETRFITSYYFIYRVLRIGEEIYRMDESELKVREAEKHLLLSEEYLDGARRLCADGD